MKKYSSFDNLDTIGEALKAGEVIAFPTDTVFGLACIYDDEKAIERLKAFKKRDASKPLPMMCSSLEMIERVAILNDDAKRIIENFFPGPLTIILKKLPSIPDYVTNGRDSIAIRIPNYPEIIDLINLIDKPLLVTSANISNMPSLKKYQDVIQSLPDIDGIVTIDAKSTTASTIVDLSGDFKIVREGEISCDELYSLIGER